jgi:DNA-binding protein HU-beta
MNRAELAKAVSNQSGLPVTTVDRVIAGLIEVITLTIKTGEDVGIRGFGRFTPRRKAAGTKVNPATGERRQIPARETVVFYPSSVVKTRLNTKRRSRKRA